MASKVIPVVTDDQVPAPAQALTTTHEMSLMTEFFAMNNQTEGNFVD